MKHLLLILCMGLLLTSCITKKKAARLAYDTVAGDAVVDSREQEIIKNKYQGLFPEVKQPPVKAGVGVDSSDYLTAIENHNILLDQLINAQGVIDSLTGRKPCDITPGDSARVVKNFLTKHKPVPIKIHDTTIVEVESSVLKGTVASQQGRINGLLAENARLLTDKMEAEQKAKDKGRTNVWLWVITALLAAGNVYQLIPKR